MTTDMATAERLFDELGPILDPIAVAHDADQALWSLLIDEDVSIDVAFDEQDGELVFALDLGEVAEETAADVYELLLRFSFVWRETGGLYAALDGEGHAVLMYRRSLQGLDVQRLQAMLSNLHDYRNLWSALIADIHADDDGEAVEPEPLVPPGGLRV